MSRTHRLLGPALTVIFASCAFEAAAVGPTTRSETVAGCSAYVSVPLPAEAEKAPVPKTSPSCASYRSYRGIGRPTNYSDARACAWRERLAQKAGLSQNPEEPIAWVVGGSLILADIYVNGVGVERNIPLALRFACEAEPGMAELALRDIAKPDGSGPARRRFEFCDYAATTFTMNFCSDYESEIADDRRSEFYNSLKASMTPEQQAAFGKLLTAENAYIDAHASEVDQGGTIRNMRTLGSQDILQDLFRAEIIHFEHKKWPDLSDNQIATADALLRSEYEKKLNELRAQTKEQIDEGAVTASHLSSAEKAWEAYRDAWVAFAWLRYPAAVPGINAEITLDRYRLLKTIAAYR